MAVKDSSMLSLSMGNLERTGMIWLLENPDVWLAVQILHRGWKRFSCQTLIEDL